MPLTFSSKGTSNFKQCPAGTYLAVCDMVVFLGLQPGSGMYPDPKLQLYVRFEIPAIRVDYEKDGKPTNGPQVIGKTFTASMHKKANLRLTLESWRSKTFSEQEAEDFDIAKILGQSCMLSVIQKESGGNIYSNIGSISALPAGIAAPKAENSLMLYTGESPEDVRLLPEWLQEKIKNPARIEASHAIGSYAQPDMAGNYDFGDQPPVDVYETVANQHGAFITNDDIPF